MAAMKRNLAAKALPLFFLPTKAHVVSALLLIGTATFLLLSLLLAPAHILSTSYRWLGRPQDALDSGWTLEDTQRLQEVQILQSSEIQHLGEEVSKLQARLDTLAIDTAAHREPLVDSAVSSLTSGTPDWNGLEQCSNGTLLGAWQNTTFVPLPFDFFEVFLREARGALSLEETAVLSMQGSEELTEAFPGLATALQQTDGARSFSPPCYYHFYARDEILALLAGKWFYVLGDSNSRSMLLGLLTILDPTHNQPFDEQLWFNSTGEVTFPHIEQMDYFFRKDGTILLKSGRVRTGSSLPDGEYSVRISFKMHHDARNLMQSLEAALGPSDWQPDVLYFNSGSWDSWDVFRNASTFEDVDKNYEELMGLISSKCKPGRQACFWGTLTSSSDSERSFLHARLALMQWRHLAKITAAFKRGDPASLYVFDRFWSSHSSTQRKGGHYGLSENIWDAHRLLNAYHGLVLQNLVESGSVGAENRGGRGGLIGTHGEYGHHKKAPSCRFDAKGHNTLAACDWLPQTVTFADGCHMDESDYGEGGGPNPSHMWERNCEANIRVPSL